MLVILNTLLTHLQIYLVLLKYTPYFVFAFIIIYAFIDVHYHEPEFSLTLAIIPATLLHLAFAVYFVRHEKRFAMAVILVNSTPSITTTLLTPLSSFTAPALRT